MMGKVSPQPDKEVEIDPQQRNALFKMKSNISVKCCNLTIDGGSLEILVSNEVVHKLKLKCAPH